LSKTYCIFLVFQYVIICGVILIAQIIVIGILYGSPDTVSSSCTFKPEEHVYTHL